jgi:hypothetical protein
MTSAGVPYSRAIFAASGLVNGFSFLAARESNVLIVIPMISTLPVSAAVSQEIDPVQKPWLSKFTLIPVR